MSSLPDPEALLAVAGRIVRHAAALRQHAHTVAASCAHTTWHGPAARAFAGEVLQVCGALRRIADRLDNAAAALRRHAARVHGALDDLRRAAGDAAAVGVLGPRALVDLVTDPGRLGADGRALLGGVAHVGGDAVHGAEHVLAAVGI